MGLVFNFRRRIRGVHLKRVKRVVLPRWLCIDSDSDSPTILGYRMGSETLTMAASKKRVQKS